MRILIAEDDGVSRRILQGHLTGAGHEVVAAADGEEAWALFVDTPDVDVIISDWHMPRLDGLDLCRRLRAYQRDDYTYFLFLTALGEGRLVEGIDAGADDYLVKPLDADDLTARLKSAARVTSLHHRLLAQNKELERLTAELEERSRNDPLTGLGNRLRLEEDLGALRGRVRRYGHHYCVVLGDVDRFKAYNDHYGHLAGDEALRRIGAVIAAQCRSGDAAYRYGGEEFLVVLPEQTLENGVAFAERLRAAVERLGLVHELNHPAGVVTMSLGVAALTEATEDATPEELLRAADRALYRAKDRGRNHVVSAGPAREG
jgi:two-component system cell cycle response regulator